MRLHLLAALGLTATLLAACDRTPPGAKDDDTDTTSDDTDPVVDDTDTTPGDDTDTTPGDDTDPGGDDTFDPSGWTGAGTLTTIKRIRDGSGGHQDGDLLAVRNAVVVANRSNKGFAIQMPGQSSWAGIYVYTNGTVPHPAVGDIVEVVGTFTEFGSGSIPVGTIAELEVGTSITDSSITVIGAGGVITPVVVSAETMANPTSAEPFESMLVTVTPDCLLEVKNDPDDAFGEFNVAEVPDGADEVIIDQEFYSLPNNLPGFAVGSTFEAISGVVYFSFDLHKVGPRSSADAVGFSAAGAQASCDADTDVDTDVDSDVETDVDTDLDSDVDTDVDTDVDSDVDTDVDTDIDTDPPPDPCTGTWAGPGTLTTIEAIRDGSGGHTVGDLLAIRCVTVTAVRSTKGFTVQDPALTEYAGAYIYTGTGATLPAVGDVVTVVAGYEEFGTGTAPLGTLTQLKVDAHWTTPTYPDSEITEQPVVSAPVPTTTLSVAQAADPATAELYESMMVLLTDACPLAMTATPTFNEFPVAVVGTTTPTVLIDDEFFNYVTATPTLSVGDTIESATGPLYFSFGAFKVAPRSTADVVGYVDGGDTCP